MKLLSIEPTPNPNRISLLVKIALLGIVVASGCVLFYHDPATAGFYPTCPLYYTTGLYCPGCGSLRAIHQLFQGNIKSAFSLNPLLIILLPALGFLFLKRSLLFHPKIPWIILSILVLYGILRNINYGPFILLAPH